MIRVYSQLAQGQAWIERYRGQSPLLACVLGFTATGLLPGISAAGATPSDRQFTALADAEFLHLGVKTPATYSLPPLTAGASPVFISRAVVTAQAIPTYLFNAGLPIAPSVPCLDLQGRPARCLTTGQAIDRSIGRQLLAQGLYWGQRLAAQTSQGYVMVAECVVGGTTTALAVLTGLGWAVQGMVNSSHPTCNHDQKWQVVQAGLRQANLSHSTSDPLAIGDPLAIATAVGDPMQLVVAGMALSASRRTGVLLAGGTQMLAIYALMQAIAQTYSLPWQPEQVVVGTTRWVAEDPTGNTAGLANLLQAPLLATQLHFDTAHHPQLRAYERGYVKEGVGAGGCAIAAHLFQGWKQAQLLAAIEQLVSEYESERELGAECKFVNPSR